MSLKKFNPNDILLNTLKAHPKSEFFIFDSLVYYNDRPELSGAFSAQVLNVPPGYLSLYEYNVDRISGSNSPIYPFINKDSARGSFKTSAASSSAGSGWTMTEWDKAGVGETLYGAYPLSASITRYYVTTPSASNPNHTSDAQYAQVDQRYYALRNRLNFYGTLSEHYKVTSSYANKDEQVLNIISIPSIFYGKSIQTGSVSLKWYYTGSLAGELRDSKQNGELIQVSGDSQGFASHDPLADGTGSVAGVVLYNEGIIILTGSWALNDNTIGLESDGTTSTPQWIYFGAGANDGVTVLNAGNSFASASFDLSFRGTTETEVLTLFAHAKRGEVNYSNNPTFLAYGQDLLTLTSSAIYEENSERLIFNTVSSSFSNHSASFEKQVYISQVGIYDEHKNLIAVVGISDPVLKKERDDYTFKIRLDI